MPSEVIKFTVREKIQSTPSITTLVLDPGNPDFTYRAGQFVTLLFDHLATQEVRRSYSLSSAPSVDRYPAISVRKIPNGLVSRYLCDVVTVGTELRSLPPAGQFTLPSEAQEIILIGGGSGTGPLFALIKEALQTRPELTILLINANTRFRDVLFSEKLGDLAREYPHRLKIIHFISQGVPDKVREATSGTSTEWVFGRLGNARLEMLVRQHQKGPLDQVHFYLCGPEGLMLKAENTLQFMGYPPEHIHSEQFVVVPPFRPASHLYTDARVILTDDGKEYTFPVAAGQTILEAAEAAGLSLPYSCRSGSCTTCQAQCTEGMVDMYLDSGRMDSRMTGGEVFTCVGYPLTARVHLHLP